MHDHLPLWLLEAHDHDVVVEVPFHLPADDHRPALTNKALQVLEIAFIGDRAKPAAPSEVGQA
jgi:hypothetical protein